jgi:hypothetical protein
MITLEIDYIHIEIYVFNPSHCLFGTHMREDEAVDREKWSRVCLGGGGLRNQVTANEYNIHCVSPYTYQETLWWILLTTCHTDDPPSLPLSLGSCLL